MRSWKRKLKNLLRSRYFYNPLFLCVYSLAWWRLAKLCRYGSLRRNLPVLAACALFFTAYLIAYLVALSRFKQNSRQEPYREFTLSGNRIELPEGRGFDYQEIRWYRKKGEQIWLFLKGRRFIWLETGALSEKNRSYLELKLTQRGIFAAQFWKLPVCFLLAAVTLTGAYSVRQSAMPYQGKLSWIVEELKRSRRVKLVHDNIYEDGLDGIFADIREKVDLPERLCLVNSFNLHFLPDGTVESLDTFVKGFDENGNLTDTYLISYNRSKSDKITIWLGGQTGSGDGFEREKDLTPLMEALRVIPLKETVDGWREEVYGILYYGERNWGYNTTGIRYISSDGVVTLPPDFTEDEIEGPSISIFCPENEAVTPVRYLYRGIL